MSLFTEASEFSLLQQNTGDSFIDPCSRVLKVYSWVFLQEDPWSTHASDHKRDTPRFMTLRRLKSKHNSPCRFWTTLEFPACICIWSKKNCAIDTSGRLTSSKARWQRVERAIVRGVGVVFDAWCASPPTQTPAPASSSFLWAIWGLQNILLHVLLSCAHKLQEGSFRKKTLWSG